jgi:hypothetical protein
MSRYQLYYPEDQINQTILIIHNKVFYPDNDRLYIFNKCGKNIPDCQYENFYNHEKLHSQIK